MQNIALFGGEDMRLEGVCCSGCSDTAGDLTNYSLDNAHLPTMEVKVHGQLRTKMEDGMSSDGRPIPTSLRIDYRLYILLLIFKLRYY